MSARESILDLEKRMGQSIIGQHDVIRSILITLLCDGNLLLEGLPGLAKTRAIRSLSKHLEGEFRRIQFTPDLLPSDVTGTEMYYTEGDKSGFHFRKGPLFGNLILVDEINRAPAKVQAALLEAMEERQITVAGTTYKLPQLFMTLATQNPVEQEGTYPLPEAQLDRFLMKIQVNYPDKPSEREMLSLVRGEQIEKYNSSGEEKKSASTQESIPQQTIFDSWKEITEIHISEAIETYIIDLIDATRFPANLGGEKSEQLASWIAVGASPRASISLERASRANAWLEGRDFVQPLDVQAIIHPVLRHRMMLTYKASADGMDADGIIDTLLSLVIVP